MIRAFTGPTDSHLTFEQRLWVVQRMAEFRPVADVWRSGCATGVDTLAAHLAMAAGIGLELYLPAAPHNIDMVNQLKRHGASEVIRCPLKPTNSLAYRARNEMMLKDANRLHAFVLNGKFYRSGEWMTVNIARKRYVHVDLEVIPNI